MISFSLEKLTECFPATFPLRTEVKFMGNLFFFVEAFNKEGIRDNGSFIFLPLAAAKPREIAVPEGASTL